MWRGVLALAAFIAAVWSVPARPALANHQKQHGCYVFEEAAACADRQQQERTQACPAGGVPAKACNRRSGVSDPFYDRIFEFVQKDLVGAPNDAQRSDELHAVGRAFLDMYADSKVDLLVHRLPESVGGVYVPREHFIVIDDRLMTYTPHVVTMIMLHEIVHAYQEMRGTPTNCFQREAEAYGWQARLWRAWFGPAGKQPPGDAVELGFNNILSVDNEGRLLSVIERQPHYQRQCAGR